VPDQTRRFELIDGGEKTLTGLDPKGYFFTFRSFWSRRCIPVEPEAKPQAQEDQQYNRIGNGLGLVHDFEFLPFLS
jgi:hypothetical protein